MVFLLKKTFLDSQGIIFQSNFNKELITRWFGAPDISKVIHNGADLNCINNITAMKNTKYENIWCCAASWRPHKRLKENINYFLEHKGDNDLLIVAGHVPEDQRKMDSSIVYFGDLNQTQLYSLYKASKYFLHLAGLSRPMEVHSKHINKSISLNIIGTANVVKICSLHKIKLISKIILFYNLI